MTSTRPFAPTLALLLIALPWPAVAAPTAGARPQIIATIGPTSWRAHTVDGMLRAGMSMARFNLAHTNARSARRMATLVRRVARLHGGEVGLLFDLPGGKIRLGNAPPDGVQLSAGQAFSIELGSRSVATSAHGASVSYRELARYAEVGDRMTLGDGAVELRVTGVSAERLRTQVVSGGLIRGGAGVHLHGKDPQFSNLSSRDRRKLRIAIDNGATHVGVSMVQRPEQLHAVRRALARYGAPATTRIVAKIETLSALEQLDAIVAASDMVMIARGDLEQAVGSRRALRRAERRIAAACEARGVPFIAATNYMSNMLVADRPSRANLLDVHRARRLGAAAVMLNETAIAPDPVSTVRALSNALR